MSEPSDADLVAAWAEGDARAGNDLVARHFDAIFGFFRTKIGGEIDDLIQRTFLAVLRTHDQIRDPSAFRRYLFAVARNELYGELRRRMGGPGVAVGSSSIDALAESAAPTPASQISARAEQVLLLRGLRRLPLDDQIALELFYWKGLSASEVGEVFGHTASAVRSRLQRARARLEELIGQLTADARLVESTVDGFERWASSLAVQRPA